MRIGYFPPPKTVKHPYNIEDMLEELGGGWHYASKGRYCLYHILKALQIKGPVLVPIYCCESILYPIKELGLKWYCYDIRTEDLNADTNSVSNYIEKCHADCVIAVSMYGNPCELDKLESICQSRGVKLIDDAAQSFGSILKGRKIGYFGDAGFFSFSPGKPLAGHLGGAFRVNEDYKIDYTHHFILHYIAYKDFEYNRLKEHYRKNIKGRLIGLVYRLLFKLLPIKNDIYSRFEEGIVYGVYKDSLYIYNPLRSAFSIKMEREVITSEFRIIIPKTAGDEIGIAHKYILVCKNPLSANSLNSFLHKNNIISQLGYNMLTDVEGYPNAREIDGRIVEIPLIPEESAYNYTKSILIQFINKINQ